MRLNLTYSNILCGILATLCLPKASPNVVINRCCASDQFYDAVEDTCKPWPGATGKTGGNISGGNATDLDGISYSPVSVNNFNLSNMFVKKLYAGNDPSQAESFTLQDHLPVSACSSGMFLRSFCISENYCVNGTQRLTMTTRGELRVETEYYNAMGVLKLREEYYSALEYCVASIQERSIDFRICNPTCTVEVPCVQKCCDVDKIVNLHGASKVRCEPTDSVAWQPHFYTTAKSPLESRKDSPARPHYFISPPRDWCDRDKSTPLLLQQRDESSGKISWLFRMGTNQNVFRRATRFSWTEFKDRWNYSCIDGAINSSYVPENETDIFEGLEQEDMWLECVPNPPPSTMRSRSQLGIYAAAKIISCLFLLATLVVHLLLWKRQNVHGWTLMSYCLSLFFTFVLYVCKYFHSVVATRNGHTDPLCVFIGNAITFFFISTFCWMTMINFDLWWTLRKFKVASSGSKSVKRYLLYATVALLTPTIFVVIATVLDFAYGDEPESGVIVPEYGKIECGPEPEYALWTYQNGPAGIFLLFNIFFFASTVYGIYKTQEEAKFASSSSSNEVDPKARAKLFGKLLIVMGIPFVFEFISGLAERGSYGDVAWYWAIFDMINFFQGVFIFFIFVYKDEMRRQLAEKYTVFKRFAPGPSSPPGSTTSKATNSSGVSSNTPGSQETVT